ncbi:MAG: imidazole glycerol phosphate synthase subunit HisF [Clostridia bacterium]|nr:imidazole glycerol phosphate synthase subunit HisF [Clostridia bacterium]
MSWYRRVIPCLDVRDGRVVKGVRFENLRDAGDPAELAARYGEEGADEVVFLDVDASREGRGPLLEAVRRTARRLFVPLAVGGGVRDLEDVADLLRAGADKVSVNTAAVRHPELIERASRRFGAQCVVVAVDARPAPPGSGFRWEVVVEGGSRPTGLDAVAWAEEAVRRGAGEILLTSVARDGTGEGFDLELVEAVAGRVPVPVIASGGAGRAEDFVELFRRTRAAAALAASRFHYGGMSLAEVKAALEAAGIPVRPAPARPASAPAAAAAGAGLPLAGGRARPVDPGAVRWDERGLCPVVVQEADSGRLLMLAWADREALRRTLEEGRAWFWSRSRGRLWRKGEGSGHEQRVLEVSMDCDGDALLYRVLPQGPACHLGTPSCWGDPPATWLDDLERLLDARLRDLPPGSYVAGLARRGAARLRQKVGEEAVEVVLAAAEGRRRLVEEGADLLFHLLLLLRSEGVAWSELLAELRQRHPLAARAAEGARPLPAAPERDAGYDQEGAPGRLAGTAG